MTPRQRVYASLRREGFDILPWQFDLTSKAAERLKAYLGVEDLQAAIGNHLISMGDCGPQGWQPEPCAPGQRRDEFGAIWGCSPRDQNIGDWGELIDYPLKEPTSSMAGRYAVLKIILPILPVSRHLSKN